MFGHFSYLLETIFLATPVILIEWIFFYHILKKNIFPITITTIIALLLVSISEPLGIYLQAWEYGSQVTLPTLLLGTKFESYVYVFLSAISVSSITIIYANYQDKKIKKIFLQSFIDLIKLKYAFWKNE